MFLFQHQLLSAASSHRDLSTTDEDRTRSVSLNFTCDATKQLDSQASKDEPGASLSGGSVKLMPGQSWHNKNENLSSIFPLKKMEDGHAGVVATNRKPKAPASLYELLPVAGGEAAASARAQADAVSKTKLCEIADCTTEIKRNSKYCSAHKRLGKTGADSWKSTTYRDKANTNLQETQADHAVEAQLIHFLLGDYAGDALLRPVCKAIFEWLNSHANIRPQSEKANQEKGLLVRVIIRLLGVMKKGGNIAWTENDLKRVHHDTLQAQLQGLHRLYNHLKARNMHGSDLQLFGEGMSELEALDTAMGQHFSTNFFGKYDGDALLCPLHMA